MDEVRAKRAFEKGEREARLREKLEVQKRIERIRDLDDARKIQFQEKEKLLTAQAAEEKQEYLNIVSKNKQIDEHEKHPEVLKREARLHHQESLRDQIKDKSFIKKQEHLEYLEEGRKLRMAKAEEIMKLETIKEGKLLTLKQQGISDGYLAQLSKKRIE